MTRNPKIIDIIAEETGYFVDGVCPDCLEWVGSDNCVGKCNCGYKIPLSLIVPYDSTWDYTENLVLKFRNYLGLRIAGKFEGKHPEKLKLLNHVEYLKLSRYRGFDFEFLHSFSFLKSLSLDFMQFESLYGINTLKNLFSLSLVECRKLKTLRGLERMSNLKVLAISICHKIENLNQINNLNSLEYLQIDSKSIESLIGLNCPSIKKLVFSHDTRLKNKDMTPLYEMKNLQYVKFRKSLFKATEIKEFIKARPDCKTITY